MVACEFSGIVREAFRSRGFDAWSCDLLPTEIPGQHYERDVLEVLNFGWDLIISHPPCTHLAVSGAASFAEKRKNGRQKGAIDFFMKMINAEAKHVAVENPVCIMSRIYRKPDQIINPFEFGHLEQKKTCLWLKNLPLLRPTNNVYHVIRRLPKNKRQRIHYLPPSPDRWKERSRTFQGIADAMAEQWGNAILNGYEHPQQIKMF